MHKAVAVSVFALASTIAAQASGQTRSHSAKVMGTDLQLTVFRATWSKAADSRFRQVAHGVVREFQRIDALMTSWGSQSDVARINLKAGKARVKVSPETFRLIARAMRAARATGGAFDITMGSFRGLWKFDQDRDGTLPSAQRVAGRLQKVGYQHLELFPKTHEVCLRKAGSRISLGGIAKGYAVDRGVALLRAAGYHNFLLQAGGDLYIAGRKGAMPWRVGVRDPRGSSSQTFAVAQPVDQTFSTSGDYERSVVKAGTRYHHILDPKTGYPATRSRSVTILAKDALTADIWSTAIFVIGAKRGLPMIEARSDLEAIIVDAQNGVHVSSGLSGKVWIHRQPSPGI